MENQENLRKTAAQRTVDRLMRIAEQSKTGNFRTG